VTIADTFGMSHPLAVQQFFKRFRSWFPGKMLEFHCHNDYGMAVANALCAVTGGANSVHTAINGLGERAGNIALEEFAIVAQTAMGLRLGLNLERLAPLCRLVEQTSRFPVAGNKPVCGRNLFNVDSGLIIHILSKSAAAGVPATVMMPYMPEMVGRSDLRYVAGKGAGGAAIDLFLKEAGIAASDGQKREILSRLKAHSTLTKSFLSPEEFAALAREVIGPGGR
jgi:isopropylmalate/homocitrate/citramalate synthase